MGATETFRTEEDFLGSKQIPRAALYGIHTQRALENFPIAQRSVCPELIRAYGAVKLAAAQTNHELGGWDETQFAAITQACSELRDGLLDNHVVVDALQGGAGTSTNMNVNEVIANRALQILGKEPGDYQDIHPINDINRHQSTNDTYPTALKVAAISGLRRLEQAVIALLEAFQEKEREFRGIVKVGRTQLQDAVLTTLGRSMSTYAEALGRDRWRIYKCEERLRVVNLGGTAIGTGLGAPQKYIFRATEKLKAVTGFGLARAENLIDNTQNADVFVEVSGILSACATNLLKCATDLRLMSSGPDAGLGEIHLPAVQAGSSIMPGKVNPVIPEAVSQAAMMVMSNHTTISQACAMGNLELNAFLPLIAESLLESLRLLAQAAQVLAEKCVRGIRANEKRCQAHVHGATATVTALIEKIGYKAAEGLLQESEATQQPLRDIVVQKGLLRVEAYDALISAETVTRLGQREVKPCD